MANDEEVRKAIREAMESTKLGSGLHGATANASDGKPATSTTVDFTHTMSESELRSTYLNLTDDRGRTFGATFPPHKTKLRVIDGRGIKSYASKHHKNQIWGSIQNWFYENRIEPGDVIQISYDPSEREDDYPVIRLVPLREGSPCRSSDLIGAKEPPSEASTEIPVSLEKQIEDFLEKNVGLIESGLTLFESEDRSGRQYPTDVGVIDLLCRKPNGDFVVVELKRGRGSDIAVGQISRYIGWIKEHLAEGRNVFGIILAADSDDRMRYAVSANPNIRARYFRLKLELSDSPPD